MMRQRIEEAKKLLAQSEKKVSQIALEVGFHDIKYFGRAFREKVSMCPVEYRESARQSEGPSKP
jgi:two-component system response regulator YesN